MDLTMLADYTPYVLILGGVVAASWLLEKLAKPAPVVGKPVSGLVKLVSFFGLFVGVLLLVTAVGTWSAHAWDTGTRYLLVVAGLALVFKPLKDVPWAALVGLIVGGTCTGAVYLLFPLPETVLGVSSIWVYLAIFLIPALFAYMLFKFVEDVFKLIGMVLTSKPVALALGILCVIQGILLLLNISLFTVILP